MTICIPASNGDIDLDTVLYVPGLLTNHNMMSLQSKYIDVYHDFCFDRIRRRDIRFMYCPSSQNMAELFTKRLARPAFTAACAAIGMTIVI